MLRVFFVIAVLATPVVAEEKVKPAALTPKEIADGWLMLFDGETTFGWTIDGEAEVKDGVLVLKPGDKEANLTARVPFAACEFRLRLTGSSVIRFVSGTEMSSLGVGEKPSLVSGTLRPGKANDSTGFYHKDGSEGWDVRATATGPAFLRISTMFKQTVRISSVAIRPIDTQPLFNGKDLTGWKVFPGAKDRKVTSKFAVTPEGWLNVKDGPGDLQTEGHWADFVVQFDCISNGKHLNSGLFFRCLPNQYQQGYEAQIRNEWTGDDRTKPVDFGTGAIYRRQPARKVVSTDKEWFTMTVAAHGRNIATWVNGYPVVSWTDDRKESENARQGFKAGKGALSIQGHDPTTDLSFRNIRIQSLDPK
jgi:hypothetical protein